MIKNTVIDLTVSFYVLPGDTSRTRFLTYYLARYNMQGKFEGMQKLQSQLNLCPMDYD